MSAVRGYLSLWPYALVAFLYVATWPYHRGLNNPNEMARVYMSRSLDAHDSFVIDRVIREWGMVDDKAIRDGKLYSSKAPLQSLIGVPAHAVAKPLLEAVGAKVEKRTITIVLRIFGSAVFGIAFAWILIAWCRRRAVELADSAAMGTGIALALALGTMLYPYSLTFTGHAVAAAAAGGVYLLTFLLARAPPGEKQWRIVAVLMGFAGGATPFAEYPAALVAAPALVAAFVITKPWKRRGELFGWLAVGGALPFAIGLWAHAKMWGSPFKTGYSFLENKGYVEVHGDGFFGVTYPKWDAFYGSLFSGGTGLFFFSPILAIGLGYCIYRCFAKPTERVPRAIPIAGFVGFVLSMIFLSGHEGWRGGWTVGPRYIISVAPVLGLWVLEALTVKRLRPVIFGLGALSVITTGFAAALYPHLSDVFTNPLWTFLLPSYVRGETTYGLAHTFGLSGGAANMVHIVPLVVATIFVAVAGIKRSSAPVRAIASIAIVGVGIGWIAMIDERDALAARRENKRLWGFWEPKSGPQKKPPRARPGRIWSARAGWKSISVERIKQDGTKSGCENRGRFCQFGEHPWQKFGPDFLEIDVQRRPIVFLHPIAKEHIRATFPVRPDAKTLVFQYGLADASVMSDNPEPVVLELVQDGKTIASAKAGNELGFHELEVPLSSTSSITLDVTVAYDGARVFGFEITQYR